MVGLSTYLSKYFSHASSLGLLAAKCTCRQDVGSTGHKLKSQKCVCMGGRCLLPTRTWELETSYTLWRRPFEIAVFNSDNREYRPDTSTCKSNRNKIIASNRIERNKTETIVSKRKKSNQIKSKCIESHRIEKNRIESNRK